MTDWAGLRDAYGPATEVPRLLQEAERGGDASGLWSELWGRLCHQGSTSPASYAALPLLAEICGRHPAAAYMAPLHLASGIVAALDSPLSQAEVRATYAESISQLRRVALRNLASAISDTDFIYGVEALMAFEDRGVWQRNLSYLADGELPFECPTCGEFLILDLDDEPFELASCRDRSLPRKSVVAREPRDRSSEARALEVIRGGERSKVERQFLSAIGDAQCTKCDSNFEIPSVLT